MAIAESRVWQLDAVRFTGTAAESRAWSGTYLLTCMDTTLRYGANGCQAWSGTYLLTSIKPFSQ